MLKTLQVARLVSAVNAVVFPVCVEKVSHPGRERHDEPLAHRDFRRYEMDVALVEDVVSGHVRAKA